ncbi:MAG: hypothetical protein E7L17_14620 [Clostridium sp.]|uniref:hypothetical protein n=1 Tax=Clostridium sp. TaxID=1506 RepID=UPI00290A4AD7|nr:hypothetical protein [Clostridium sp.]MDU7339334.1 hypothetical protein [Clostridium sp.]
MTNILQTLLDTYQTNPAAALAQIPELGQAVEDGKIIELPCKVGTNLFYITKAAGLDENKVEFHMEIRPCIMSEENAFLIKQLYGFRVFGTREEAEQSLKERGKNG